MLVTYKIWLNWFVYLNSTFSNVSGVFFEAIPAIIPKVFSEEKSQKTFFPSIRAIRYSLRYFYKVLRYLFFKNYFIHLYIKI